jgi:outer membrane protein OmpA-like peptidoglycan-associated protein
MRRAVILFCLVTLPNLVCCAGDRGVVVLLPDQDGKTGQITVSTKGGTLLLKEPHQATAIRSSDLPPGAPFSMQGDHLRETFGAAIASLPEPPIHFILYFKTGTTHLTEESRNLLVQILPTVVARNSSDISVVGHTDRVGTRKDNFALGLDRAYLIKQILISRGIDQAIIEIESHGEDNPLIPTPDGTDEPKNRRVEVIIR